MKKKFIWILVLICLGGLGIYKVYEHHEEVKQEEMVKDLKSEDNYGPFLICVADAVQGNSTVEDSFSRALKVSKYYDGYSSSYVVNNLEQKEQFRMVLLKLIDETGSKEKAYSELEPYTNKDFSKDQVIMYLTMAENDNF